LAVGKECVYKTRTEWHIAGCLLLKKVCFKEQ